MTKNAEHAKGYDRIKVQKIEARRMGSLFTTSRFGEIFGHFEIVTYRDGEKRVFFNLNDGVAQDADMLHWAGQMAVALEN